MADMQRQQQHYPNHAQPHPHHQQASQQTTGQVASPPVLSINRAQASASTASASSAMSGLETQTPKKSDFNMLPPTPSSSQQQQQQQQHSMSTLPNTLLPGANLSSRPATSATTYSAPQTVPTMPPPINTNQQQYTPRPPTLNPQHSHSRSSPAGLDQKYIAFSTTPTKGYNSVTPSSSHSPLGLADIRPRTNSDLLNRHGMQSGPAYDYGPSQTNSSYIAPWAAYSFDWCKWPVPNGNSCGKMAIGSYLEDPHNFIQIVDTQIAPQDQSTMGGPAYGLDFVKVAEATCAYPVTRISWEPPSSSKQSTDLLATSGDHLRLWSLPSSSQPAIPSNNINRSASVNTREQPTQKLQPLALLSNSKSPEHTAPLTSLDWNTLSPKLIITSSIDTTCTIWDIPTLTAKTQLIAHDKEVFDVRFCAGSVDVFVSCGADGSVRMFDLRSLEHSTIIYEPSEKSDKDKGMLNSTPKPGASVTNFTTAALPASPTKSSAANLPASPPLLRLAASPHDAHLLATFAADSNIVRILDARQPGTALLELRGHSAALNSIEWNPSRRGMLASGGDDSQVLVWDLLNSGNGASVNGGAQGEAQTKGPSASWRSDYEVNNVSWAPQSALTGQGGDWLGVCAGRGVWGVKL
ncbi:WD40 repeat-like protein [Aureobasidium subglaciale]|nr:WD40 repeat-like protein [Aureobasidium subglaciale]